MRRTILAAFFLAAAALAGCLDGARPSEPDGSRDPADDGGKDPGAGTGAGPGTGAGTGAGRTGGGNASAGAGAGSGLAGNATSNATGPPREWALPAVATIRPGAALDDGGCTANFVFTSLDNRTVYLGTAAHCFSNDLNTETDGCLADLQPLGTTRKVQGADHPGVLVYSSWAAMQARGTSGDLCGNNDFALLQLHPDDAAKVSPALRVFGGPTGLAGVGDVGTFDKVLSYGNSNSRPEDSALSPREGYVTLPADGCDSRVVFPNPAIPGDSGSAVILADGLAFGVFVSIELAPLPGQGHVCLLEDLLAFAAQAGLPVRLATWDLLDGGVLP